MKLSDRNVAEIIDCLMKVYDTKLLFSNDGREYLTPNHLVNEIIDVANEYGRINIVEMPKILNISIEKVENRINDV